MSIWESIDKAEVQGGKFEILPEGVYISEVTDIEISETMFPEGATISVEFTIKTDSHLGRKCWWNSKLTVDSSPKAAAFVKTQICKLAGVETTAGNPMDVLLGTKGNNCLIEIQHSQGTKDPSKTYANVYVREKLS